VTEPRERFSGDPQLLAELERLADQVRHPALGLYSFLAGPVEVDETVEEPDEADLLSAGATLEDLQRARLRRAAVLYTANLIIARCLEDLTLQQWDPDTLLPITDPDTQEVEESFVWDFFPPRFRHTYTREFHTKVLITASKVAYDLARPDGRHAACIAEELILNAICRLVELPWDLAGLGRPWLNPSEDLLEDTDFDLLFHADMDGIEADPAAQADHAMWIPGPADWFTPFNDERVVHPYCQTEPSTPVANDLHPLLDEDSYDQLHDPAVVDDRRPITGLTPISDAVAQARAEHGRDSGHGWVPDHTNPEHSFAEGATIVAGAVSGWLTWQPTQGNDLIRTQPVIQFALHRHFPVGRDQPWAAVAITTSMLCVPLSAVVAFRPDPAVREDWNQKMSKLLSEW
jgi:hypothetical protein